MFLNVCVFSCFFTISAHTKSITMKLWYFFFYLYLLYCSHCFYSTYPIFFLYFITTVCSQISFLGFVVGLFLSLFYYVDSVNVSFGKAIMSRLFQFITLLVWCCLQMFSLDDFLFLVVVFFLFLWLPSVLCPRTWPPICYDSA